MNKILFLCVGDSNIIGDSLGPLVGTIIKENLNDLIINRKIEVMGTINKPIGYKKLMNIKEKVNNNNKEIIVIIDSALGSKENIGKIIINNNILNAGVGLRKGILLKGNISIKAIVGNNYNNRLLNSLELLNISENKINSIAYKIINNIIPFII